VEATGEKTPESPTGDSSRLFLNHPEVLNVLKEFGFGNQRCVFYSLLVTL
jgi:hypothetical protein